MNSITLGQLKTGDSYGNGKYRVLSNLDGVMQVIRLSDNWRIQFHDKQVNWKQKVKKDD